MDLQYYEPDMKIQKCLVAISSKKQEENLALFFISNYQQINVPSAYIFQKTVIEIVGTKLN